MQKEMAKEAATQSAIIISRQIEPGREKRKREREVNQANEQKRQRERERGGNWCILTLK